MMVRPDYTSVRAVYAQSRVIIKVKLSDILVAVLAVFVPMSRAVVAYPTINSPYHVVCVVVFSALVALAIVALAVLAYVLVAYHEIEVSICVDDSTAVFTDFF